MDTRSPFPDYAVIEADIAKARAERAARMGELLAAGARAFTRKLARLAEALRDAYASERRRSAAPAQEALRKWAGIH